MSSLSVALISEIQAQATKHPITTKPDRTKLNKPQKRQL